MYEINIYDVIRRNIKKYRMLKKMTQAELAEKTNLTHDFIRYNNFYLFLADKIPIVLW